MLWFDPHGAPRALPLFGHALAMRSDPLRLLTELERAHGDVAPIRLGPMRGFVVSAPELVGEVLVSKRQLYTRKTRVYEALSLFLGPSILTTEGEDWRVHRRIVQPAFHKERLSSFAADIVRSTEAALDGWSGEVEMSEAMTRLTLRIVSETLLGTRTDRIAAEVGATVESAQRWVETVLSSMVVSPPWLPTPRNLARVRVQARLDRIAEELIAERSDARGSDAVSMLLDARYEDGTALSPKRIRNELVTLLAAGHETTASALAWTLLELGQHPVVARRLEAEVDEGLGGRPPTFDDLRALPYTRWVLDESMRLHPPAWTTGRIVLEPHTLGDQALRPGQMLLISPYVTQRREDLWERPLVFDPARWEALSARGALRPFTFFPFGGGTRKCVGEAFAYLEATLVLAMIAQRFSLELVEGQRVEPLPRITLGLSPGLRMRARPRSRA